jgi:hypothetical protein
MRESLFGSGGTLKRRRKAGAFLIIPARSIPIIGVEDRLSSFLWLVSLSRQGRKATFRGLCWRYPL